MSILRCEKHGRWDSDFHEVCPLCPVELVGGKPRVFGVNDPREKIREDIAKAKRRFRMLGIWEERYGLIIKTARKYISSECPVEIDIQAQITWMDKDEVRVEINIRDAESWHAVTALMEGLDAAGYELDRWTSSDHPSMFSRNYQWLTDRRDFGIEVWCKVKEGTTACRRVLVGVKEVPASIQSGYKKEIYAFDCGDGEEATRQRALAAGALN